MFTKFSSNNNAASATPIIQDEPQCVITTEDVTDIPDLILFGDGHFYSKSALKDAQKTKNTTELYSPMYNDEIKLTAINPGYALQSLIGYTKSLKKSLIKTEEKYNNLLAKYKAVELVMDSDKKEYHQINKSSAAIQAEFINQTALAIQNKNIEQSANVIKKFFSRIMTTKNLEKRADILKKNLHTIKENKNNHDAKTRTYKEEMIHFIQEHKLIKDEKERNNYYDQLKMKVAFWKMDEERYIENLKERHSELKATKKIFLSSIKKYKKFWLTYYNIVKLNQQQLADLKAIQMQNASDFSKTLQQDKIHSLTIFGGTRQPLSVENKPLPLKEQEEKLSPWRLK